MASIKLKGDTSGEVIISAPSVAGNTTLELPATSSTLATQNSLGLRNLIINGDMNIDQRNAGASATTTSNVYTVDRFQLYAADVTNAQTYQQVTDAPAGFNKSLKITNSSTAQAAGSAALYTPRQRIEGYNTAHLNWGTSDAQTVTVSFWVKASVTGTYPFAINNGSFNRSFVSNYTISSANTWEYKTVTVAGDTSGTWNVNNSSGMIVMFSLDTNSSYETSTVDAWQTGSFRATSSNVHFLANASATWQITGVQLEANTTATPFEHLQFGQQLALCKRYYEHSYPYGTVAGASNGGLGAKHIVVGLTRPNNYGIETVFYTVEKRASATVVMYTYGGLAGSISNGDSGAVIATADAIQNSTNGFLPRQTGGTTLAAQAYIYHYSASSEL